MTTENKENAGRSPETPATEVHSTSFLWVLVPIGLIVLFALMAR